MASAAGPGPGWRPFGSSPGPSVIRRRRTGRLRWRCLFGVSRLVRHCGTARLPRHRPHGVCNTLARLGQRPHGHCWWLPCGDVLGGVGSDIDAVGGSRGARLPARDGRGGLSAATSVRSDQTGRPAPSWRPVCCCPGWGAATIRFRAGWPSRFAAGHRSRYSRGAGWSAGVSRGMQSQALPGGEPGPFARYRGCAVLWAATRRGTDACFRGWRSWAIW